MAYTKQQNEIKKSLLAKGITNVKRNKYQQWELYLEKQMQSNEEFNQGVDEIVEIANKVAPHLIKLFAASSISPMGTKTYGIIVTFRE